METKQNRYCDIKWCINQKGSKSKEFHFFRVPKNVERRQKWISAIETHQEFGCNSRNFNVCSLHFSKNDYQKERVLKLSCFPTIFEQPSESGTIIDRIEEIQTLSACDVIVDQIEDAPILSACDVINDQIQDTPITLENDMLIHDVLSTHLNRSHESEIKISNEDLKQEHIVFQEKLLQSDIALYKANDYIKQLESKVSDLKKKKKQLMQSLQYYRQECKKLKNETIEGLSDEVSEIVNCLLGRTKLNYSKSVRQFALTINFYSPKAYRYIREKFNRCLPHQSTLNKYYVNSGADGEPGIGKESMNALVRIVKDFQDAGKKFYCTLTFDEVMIRSHIQYVDAKKVFEGFITYGEHKDPELPVANNAIVFMINGLNTKISLPVAHHFITALNKQQKANLLESVITTVTEAGAIIVNITCDGLQCNFSVFTHFGASLKSDDIRPFIKNPCNGEKIYIMFDACHMLKLTRNILLKKHLTDSKDQDIKWQHFMSLESMRTNKDFIRHKLTKKHIDCFRNKMNVALAAQTLSRSVAKAMEFMMEAHKEEFHDASGTIAYSRCINDLFDILNTGHDDTLENNENNKLKVPISPATKNDVFKVLDECAAYIRGLRLDDKSILKSPQKTAFLGFLIDVVTVKSIYEDLVETGKIDQLATFHASQDPLESFFGRIRSKCGNNINPTVEQFKSAFRKILINNEISASTGSNCFDNLSIYFVSSHANSTQTQIHDEQENVETFDHFCENDYLLDAYQDATICQIASNIENKIRTQANFECDLCMNVLNENEKVYIDIFEKKGLYPCVATVYVCKVAQKYFDIFRNKIKYDYINLIEIIQKEIRYEHTFKCSDFSEHSTHKNYFVQYIAEEFLRVRAVIFARDLTLKEREKILQHRLNKKNQLDS